MCQSEEDTTERALECNKGYKKFNLNDERGKEWGEMVQIYRKNNNKRSLDNIQEDQNIRQKLREDGMRQISGKKKIQEKVSVKPRDSKGTEKREQTSKGS